MTEPAIHRKENRTKIAELIFEKLSFEQMFISKSPVLSSFSVGCTTSLVFDSGENNTYAVPVQDGYISQSMIYKSKVAGSILTEGLKRYLDTQSFEISPISVLQAEYEGDEESELGSLDRSNFTESAFKYQYERILKDIKKSVLECNLEPISKRDPSYGFETKAYTLPDGSSFELKGDQFKIPEILFLPGSLKNEENKNEADGDAKMLKDDIYNKKLEGFNGFQSLIQKAINASDIDIRRDLYKHILCTGGTTLMKNFERRLKKDIEGIAPQNCTVNLIKKQTTGYGDEDVLYSPFIGASILSSLSSFKHMWFTKQEYEENGAYYIEKKCP